MKFQFHVNYVKLKFFKIPGIFPLFSTHNVKEVYTERDRKMVNLKQSELNWIREVASAHNTTASKLGDYANQVTDPQLKQMFSKASTDAKNAANNLIQML